MNKVLFQHPDGTIYVSVKRQLIKIYAHTSKYELDRVLHSLAHEQRRKLQRMRLAQLYLQQLVSEPTLAE